MARVAPLLTTTSSLVLLLTPIVLTLLVASWPTPALVEAKSLQAHDEPQWKREVSFQSPQDAHKMPFGVRVRRSPQSGQDPDEATKGKPGFLSSFWTSIKNFTSHAARVIVNFITHMFGGGSSTPDNDNTEPPKSHDGDQSSPRPGEHSGGPSEYVDDNTSTSSPSREYWNTIPTASGNVGEKSPPSSESYENTSLPNTDFTTSSDIGKVSSLVPIDNGSPSLGDGSTSENNYGNGSSPVPIGNGSSSFGDGSASENNHGNGSSPVPIDNGSASFGDGSASENNYGNGSSPVPIGNGSPSFGDGSASENNHGNGSSPVPIDNGIPSFGDGSASENNHGNGSSPVPIDNGSLSFGDGSASENNHGEGNSPNPGDGNKTTPAPFVFPNAESEENEIEND